MVLGGELLEALTWGRVFIYSILFLVVAFTLDFASQPRYPSQIPVLGYGKGWIAKFRNTFAYFTQHQSWIEESYEKYDKAGVAYILQANMSRAPNLVIPRTQIPWMMDQPDTILSSYAAHDHNLYSKYNFLGAFNLDSLRPGASSPLVHHHFSERLVHKYLPRHVSGLIPAIEDEVRFAVEHTLRTADSETWTSFNLWEMWLEIIQRVTSRIMVGEPVCRDPEFLVGIVAFTDATVRNSFLLNMIPKILHPIFGRLFAISNWIHWRRSHKRVLPVIQKRLRDIKRKEAGDEELANWTPDEDFITWAIRLAKQENNVFEQDPTNISKRLLPVAFAAIYTTVLTGQMWMLDMLSTSPEDDILGTLRAEIEAHRPPSGSWNKARLSSLVRMDSSIRESQRLSPFSSTLIERQVVAPEGLHSPKYGWTAPQGSFVTVNLYGLHHDGNLYENPMSYDPLRFSRQREAFERQLKGEKKTDEKEANRVRSLAMVTTSDEYLAFGHGRHACPGRFFVAYELKLIMSHILLNYDIRMIKEKPQPIWLGGGIIPALKASVEIRRR
ncbi:cytochrome P450 [Xylogone sp. PMI_703]|nr:cytochrome P450 [Xylogone sp. PMI_703]